MTLRGLEHRALPYGSTEGFVAQAAPFLRGGLEREETTLAMVSGPRLSNELRRALGADARSVGFLDPASWYVTPPHAISSFQELLASQPPGVRIRAIGEPIWAGRTPEETREWLRYEALLNRLFVDGNATIACPYDLRAVGPEVVTGARRTHASWGTTGPLRDDLDEDLASLFDELDREPLPPPPADARDVRFDARGLRAVRRAIADVAAGAGMDPERVSEAILAVNEVATNVVRHGAGRGLARLWRTDDALVAEVEEESEAALEATEGWLPPAEATGGRYGLWIVRRIADQVDVRAVEGSLRIRLRLRLRPV